ncbi:MAG: CDP-archaeol synthase [Anaerolineaceae bacterium]|nr:CDP-archaeol synthase [Anaerolineaceae bacterium]
MENFLHRMKLDQMLVKRLLVVIILTPLGILAINAGGWIFNITIIMILGIAAWEFWRIFTRGGFHPSRLILILSTVAISLVRSLFEFSGSEIILGLIILAAMADQTIRFGDEDQSPALNFCITVTGALYIGFLGSYMISIRMLENGNWLLLLILPIVWMADGGAYLIGRLFGKRKLAAKVSPNKTWEGYFGGVAFGTLGGGLLTYFLGAQISLFSPLYGLFIGLILSLVSPLGDLGESMIKRQFGVKDSGKLLPGHGGILDRIDSWLWASFIGYYLLLILI